MRKYNDLMSQVEVSQKPEDQDIEWTIHDRLFPIYVEEMEQRKDEKLIDGICPYCNHILVEADFHLHNEHTSPELENAKFIPVFPFHEYHPNLPVAANRIGYCTACKRCFSLVPEEITFESEQGIYCNRSDLHRMSGEAHDELIIALDNLVVTAIDKTSLPGWIKDSFIQKLRRGISELLYHYNLYREGGTVASFIHRINDEIKPVTLNLTTCSVTIEYHNDFDEYWVVTVRYKKTTHVGNRCDVYKISRERIVLPTQIQSYQYEITDESTWRKSATTWQVTTICDVIDMIKTFLLQSPGQFDVGDNEGRVGDILYWLYPLYNGYGCTYIRNEETHNFKVIKLVDVYHKTVYFDHYDRIENSNDMTLMYRQKYNVATTIDEYVKQVLSALQ